MQNKVLEFLKSQQPRICVLATTCDKGAPHCAAMLYTVSDDLSLILSAHKSTRKCGNLKNNFKVALTFGFNFGILNIQYEGMAELIEEGEEYKKCEEIYFKDHPEAERYKGLDMVFIKIKPQWIRLSDYSVEPPVIEEMNF